MIVSIVFFIDIIVNFMSAYERYDGSYEYSLKKIALNYIFGFFVIDFIAIFPVDIIMEINQHHDQGAHNRNNSNA